jgi:hypothetical protein
MNNKISNPFLKQLISEISNKTNQGRMTDVVWGSLTEGKKKKTLKKEAAPQPKEEPAPEEAGEETPQNETPPAQENPPAPNANVAGLGDVPSTEEADQTDLPPMDAGPQGDATADGGEEEVDKAKEDAVKSKAELEKAKAEKDQAEKEIEQQSHVKLVSKAGVTFLLSKIIGGAVQTNSVDAFAAELVDKLKLETEEDYASFANEMAPFRIIPGVGELLTAVKGLIGATPPDQESN